MTINQQKATTPNNIIIYLWRYVCRLWSMETTLSKGRRNMKTPGEKRMLPSLSPRKSHTPLRRSLHIRVSKRISLINDKKIYLNKKIDWRLLNCNNDKLLIYC